jgi:hypothetical protein
MMTNTKLATSNRDIGSWTLHMQLGIRRAIWGAPFCYSFSLMTTDYLPDVLADFHCAVIMYPLYLTPP